MRAARVAWESAGYTVAGAATQAVAAQQLQAETGIAARTVASWRLAGLAGIDVLVLDEASLTEDRDRAWLYAAAARTGTKLVEIGDPRQLRGVGCGSVFARVHELVAGPELTESRRQRDEDERAALAAWRAGRYGDALGSWSERGRLVATETPQQAASAMVGTWLGRRAGAPDPHTELRGLVMLAATNESVERLNDAAQAVRGALGELGPGRDYDLAGGRRVTLREGDHVMLRINDRSEQLHRGPAVLNGYRGVVDDIADDGRLTVSWQTDGPDGAQRHQAVLDPDYVARGGVERGYAMTIHKAQGLTVDGRWQGPDGAEQAGTVLVHAPGADNPALLWR
jgi:ATP-dependent exoDNAse (exonuclease V) alpha subunit